MPSSPASSPSPPPGPAVPGYVLLARLGAGATGEVWLARDEASGEQVALKRLRTGAAPGARDQVRREAAVLSAIRHPHLVRLRAVVPLPDEVVLVLDHAGGGSLADLVRSRGLLTPGEVVTLGVPLAGALAALHDGGVVHGDLAPGNVLWSGDGRPLLADLGVARLCGRSTGDDAVVEATAAFLDPAVLAGAAPGPASDVYALAAVCAWAWTGRGPVDGGLPPPGPSAADGSGAALAAALGRALAAVPGDRPSAAVFARDLYAAAPALPVRPTGPAPRPGPPQRLLEDDPLDGLDPSTLADLALGFGGGHGDAGGGDEGMTRLVRADASAVGSQQRGRSSRAGAGRSGRDRVRGRPRRRQVDGAARPVRRSLLAAGILLALAGAAATGTGWARWSTGRASAGALPVAQTAPSRTAELDPAAGAATPAAAPRPPAAATPSPGGAPSAAPARGWVQVLDDLYRARARAFAAAEPDLLAAVYAPGSADLAYTTRLLEALRDREEHAVGARLHVLTATARSTRTAQTAQTAQGAVVRPDRARPGTVVVLDVVDRLDASTVADRSGRTVGATPGRPAARAVVRLRATGAGWRVEGTGAP